MHDPRIHIAVVYGPGRVELVVLAPTDVEREHRVAEYVRRRVELLSPGSRRKVLSLLRGGATKEAIQAYFDAIGPEWDHEWLHLEPERAWGASVPGIDSGTGRRARSIA